MERGVKIAPEQTSKTYSSSATSLMVMKSYTYVKSHMKNRILIILLLVFPCWSSIAFSQFSNLKLYSDGNISCYLHQINDTLLYITNQEYSFESGYLLGTYKLENNKLVIDEIDFPVTIKQDVYYWDWNASRNDSLLVIEYFRTDFIMGGHSVLDSLKFKINNTLYPSEDARITVGARSIDIPRPSDGSFEIEMIYGDWIIAKVQISIKPNDRSVLIEEQIVNSMNPSPMKDILPKYIEIEGVKTKLILNELEH